MALLLGPCLVSSRAAAAGRAGLAHAGGTHGLRRRLAAGPAGAGVREAALQMWRSYSGRSWPRTRSRSHATATSTSPRAGRRPPALRSTSWPSIRTIRRLFSCSPLTATLMSPSVTGAPRHAAPPWTTVPLWWWRRGRPAGRGKDVHGRCMAPRQRKNTTKEARASPSPPVPSSSAAQETVQDGLPLGCRRCPRPSLRRPRSGGRMNMERKRRPALAYALAFWWRADRAVATRGAAPQCAAHASMRGTRRSNKSERR